MRKVDSDNITKPTLKILMQVFIPYNDGSNNGELIESQDFCYLDESNEAISKMSRAMVSDAKAIAVHHARIMAIRRRGNPAKMATPHKMDIVEAPAVPSKGVKAEKPSKKASKK